MESLPFLTESLGQLILYKNRSVINIRQIRCTAATFSLCPARAALCLSRFRLLCTCLHFLARRLWLRRDGFCSAASKWRPLCGSPGATLGRNETLIIQEAT